MSLGNNIKKYRRDLGLTQEELAGILCVTGQAVSKWESGVGMPDVTQIVPLAQALNVSTDALFGFSPESYDKKYAEEVHRKANELRDSGEQSQGALNAVEYLDQQCEENVFNYGIMMRYVQAVAHMSRFVNPQNSYFSDLMKEDEKKWKKLVRTAENRANQVIRYSGDKELAEQCHYAMAWLCWHLQEWEKGRQHIAALPSIGSNMLQETLLMYYIPMDTEEGKARWKAQIRDNYQNYIRAINKQIVYTAEATSWVSPLPEVEEYCRYGLAIMDQFMENDLMKYYCQGFYRETVKYFVAAYLKHGEPEKAAEEWKKLLAKIDDYVLFCRKESEKDPVELNRIYGEKAADGIRRYTREYIDAKLEFMLGQIKSRSDKDIYVKFEKLIG